jgi:hypothetical protein
VPPLLLVAITKSPWLGDRRLVALAQVGEDPCSLGKRGHLARSTEEVLAETLPAPMEVSAAMALKVEANRASPQ